MLLKEKAKWNSQFALTWLNLLQVWVARGGFSSGVTVG